MQNKLLINISLLKQPLTGIGNYILNILAELLSRDLDIIGVKDGVIFSRVQLQELVDGFAHNRQEPVQISSIKRFLVSKLRNTPGVYRIKDKVLLIRSQRALSKLAEQGYIYFEPSFVPLDYNGTIVTTIHDLSFITHPDFHPATRVKYLQRKIEESIAKTNHIIVDSSFILKELNENYPSTIGCSSYVYLGVTKSFKAYSRAECEPFLTSKKIDYKKFILSVATLEPRKNLQQLVKAYKLLPDEVRKSNPLVLVGDQGWKNSELLDEAKNLIEKNQIVFTGYVSDQELKLLYASAKLFVYPSLYEGFGLPVIEAMASGVPVITSNIGATAEVSKGGAALVDPLDAVDIANTMQKALGDRELQEKLTLDGMERAKEFTWKKTVDEILEVASIATSR